jgi:hypothetical protein
MSLAKQFTEAFNKIIGKTYTGTSGLYVGVPYKKSTNSIKSLQELFKYELPLESFQDLSELHCTVMYSKTAPSKESVIKLNKDYPVLFATPIYCQYWEGHDKSGYLVLKLTSNYLQNRHKKYLDIGAVPTFSPYEPHITLAKGFTPDKNFYDTLKSVNKSKIFKDIGTIEFGQETVKDIDL